MVRWSGAARAICGRASFAHASAHRILAGGSCKAVARDFQSEWSASLVGPPSWCYEPCLCRMRRVPGPDLSSERCVCHASAACGRRLGSTILAGPIESICDW
jgi:hypothetical protein